MISLTTRQRDLLHYLLTAETAVVTADVGRRVGLTPRQVSYSLKPIKMWLVEHDADLDMIPGVGVQVACPPDYKQDLLTELASQANIRLQLTPGQRQQLEQLLQQNRGQALTAVALNHLTPFPTISTPAGAIGWASDVIQAEAAMQPVADLLLRPILLVDEATTAYELALSLPPGTLAVSRNGFVAHAGGLVQTSAADDASSVLAREEAWRQAHGSDPPPEVVRTVESAWWQRLRRAARAGGGAGPRHRGPP